MSKLKAKNPAYKKHKISQHVRIVTPLTKKKPKKIQYCMGRVQEEIKKSQFNLSWSFTIITKDAQAIFSSVSFQMSRLLAFRRSRRTRRDREEQANLPEQRTVNNYRDSLKTVGNSTTSWNSFAQNSPPHIQPWPDSSISTLGLIVPYPPKAY